jgi:hypothetical protein
MFCTGTIYKVAPGTSAPLATPPSAPLGLTSESAANTPTAAMMTAPGYWNRAPDSSPPA